MNFLKILVLSFTLFSSYGGDFILQEEKKISQDPCPDRSLKPYMNTLVGERLFLRPVFPQDYVSFLPIFTDPVTMKYVGSGVPSSPERVQNVTAIWAFNNNQAHPASFNWAIIIHEGVVGRLAFFTNNEKEEPIDEIAYGLNPAFHGRGIGTDAVRLAVKFKEGPILATVHPSNIPSREILKKLGFQADLSRMNVPKYGSFRDYYLSPEKD